jgi:3-deoxy-D-manno-octulosonic-acid transferase
LSYFLYSVSTLAVLPFGLLRLWWRSRTSPGYGRRWRERLGWYAHAVDTRHPRVVFHAVSVGEVHAAQPLIDAFMQRYPHWRVLVTTSTPTGSERVHKLFGVRVEHVYLPFDYPAAVRRFYSHFQPRLLILLETELWPNLLRLGPATGCRLIVANARLSERSKRSYQRFVLLAGRMLSCLDLVAAQSEADGSRFIELGLDPRKLNIIGSLKFDVSIPAEKIELASQLKPAWLGRGVWIAASTRDREEAKVLEAFMQVLQVQPQTLLLLVPRHPERFAQVAREVRSRGLALQYFSKGEALLPGTQVLLGDTMGDMMLYYALADLAFVGGSLVDTGCQNIIEPAALALPVITGPSLYNFRKVSELLRDAGGMQVVGDARELATVVTTLLQDPLRRQEMGARARREVLRNQGAAGRLLELLTPFVTHSATGSTR